MKPDEIAQEFAQEVVGEQNNNEFITKDKSALKRMFNLYDVKSKSTEDGLLMEDDQLYSSREQKREFLRKYYKKFRLKPIQL